MKLIYLCLILFISLQADEIERIESIVNDIAKLRVQYKNCQLKNKKLTSENEEYKNTIKYLKNKIKTQEKQLNTKEKSSKKQIDSYCPKVKTKEKVIKKLIYKKEKEENKFPKLRMKQKRSSQIVSKEKIEYKKARTFRLNKDADIFNSIDGNPVFKWEKKRSFTSNIRTEKWIKITGYFKNKVWQKSQRELWVIADDATQR
jgi:diacylglycerol kinase family enzyme